MSNGGGRANNRKLNRTIAVILVLLAIGILFLAYFNRPQNAAQPGTISIISQGETTAVLTMKEVQALPKVEKEVTINSASEGKSTDMWGGVSMMDVLDHVDPQLLLNAEQVITRAEDGFTSVLQPAEVLAGDDVLIAYEKNGELLKGKTEGGLGPFRLILAQDPFGNRMTKYLNELELK